MTEPDDSWRTPAFRQKVLNEIDEVINASGNPAGKSSQDMENQLFQKATSKEEYLSYVARVILHMREMNDRSMSASNPHLAAALSAGNSSNAGNGGGNDMWAGGNQGGGQINMLQNQLGGGVQQNPGGGASMLQAQLNQPMHRGPVPHQIRMGGGQMMGQVSQLQSQLNQPSQLHARLSQPSQLQAQLQSGGMDGGMRMSMPQQQQQPGMQPQVQVQIGGQGQQMLGSQLQSQLNQPPRPMNVQLGPGGQFTAQLSQNVTVRGGAPMPTQGPRGGMRPTRVRMPAGMRGVQPMNVMGGRPQGPSPQMQQMPRQQQQMKPDGIMGMVNNQGGININLGQVPASQHLNQMANSAGQPQPMYSVAPGGPRPMMMGQGGGDKPSVSMMSGMPQGMGQVQVSVAGPAMHMQRAPSPAVPSPATHMAPSPMQQQQRPGFVGAPSPGGQAMNTGGQGQGNLQVIRPGGPPGGTDQAYLDKIQQLSKYVEPLKNMIAKLGEDDTDKVIKMKKLMDILTNPNTTVPMDMLLKCEHVLEKIVKDFPGSNRPSSVPPQQSNMPMSSAGPPSVPSADSNTNPLSNLPSIGTPTGGSGPSSQPGSAAPTTGPASMSGPGGPGSVGAAGMASQGAGSVGAQPGSAGPGGPPSVERSGPPSVLAPPPNLPNILTRDQQALFGPLLETIASSLKSPFFNHTMERTFGQCMESLFGPEIRLPERNYRIGEGDEETSTETDEDDDVAMEIEDEPTVGDFERSDVPHALRREISGKDPEKFAFKRLFDIEFACGHLVVECHLIDVRAPLVPPIIVYVPRNYPDDAPPFVNPDFPCYDLSEFLGNVKQDMSIRLKNLPECHTLSHILFTWELSLRHAASLFYTNRGSDSSSLKPTVPGKA